MRLGTAVRIADQIPGWCEYDELRYLGSEAARHTRVVEVGCWQGRSAKMMALMTPGVVYAVDDWRGAGGAAADGFIGPGNFPLGTGKTPHAQLEENFRRNLADEILTGKLEVTMKASPEAASLIEAPDMVYIDGDHDTEPVRVDIRAWKAVLVPGGLLCGHDAPDERVAEALRLEGIEWDLVATNIWAAR